MDKYDLVVIGSGPGGYVAAIRGAQLGLKVALVERDRLGGVCLNWGCIPTKALLRSAEVLQNLRDAAQYGLACDNPRADFAAVIKRSRGIAQTMSKGVAALLRSNHIQVIKGSARLLDAATVAVRPAQGPEARLAAEHIIIATGARPRALSGVEFDGQRILHSTHAMTLGKMPQSLAVIGAGPIGLELGYFYHSLGCQVSLVEMLPQVLPGQDHEIAQALTRSLQKRGMKIMTQARVERLTAGASGVELEITGRTKKRKLQVEVCLVAIGVQANLEGLGLEQAGVRTEAGFIKTNGHMQTNVPSIRAVGDVAGPPLLAHIASHEALVAVDHLAGRATKAMSYENYPSCTYGHPQTASVGLTEKQALEQGLDIKISTFPFSANGKAKAMGQCEGMVKLITDKRYGKLIGVHIIGPEASEVIAEYALARSMEATHEEIIHSIHAHPSLAEANQEAALGAFFKPIHI